MSERVRKSQSSAASNYQAGFMGLRPIPRQRRHFVKSPLWNPEKQRFFQCLNQGIKHHRTRRRLLMDYAFWGCIQVICSDFWWIVKFGWCTQAYNIPIAFFGVLRTFFAKKVLSRRRQNRHRRFAKRLTALSETNPQKPAFGCEQLSGWLLLSRYQKTGAHVAGFWWIILFEDVSKLHSLIFDGL